MKKTLEISAFVCECDVLPSEPYDLNYGRTEFAHGLARGEAVAKRRSRVATRVGGGETGQRGVERSCSPLRANNCTWGYLGVPTAIECVLAYDASHFWIVFDSDPSLHTPFLVNHLHCKLLAKSLKEKSASTHRFVMRSP